jgi:cation diffusion facilitator family transporter
MKVQVRERDDLRVRLIAISSSLFLGTSIMAAKFFAYHLTGSSAVLSDALESIINVVASGFALGSILTAARPPDRSHPYGHGKIEYFSAGFEGALIIFASMGIFRLGLDHLLHPRALPNIAEGIFILVGTGMVNLGLGMVLLRTGKKTDSITLIADGKHLMTDVYTSGGVLLGLILVHLTGFNRLDGIVAVILGLNILFTGAGLVRTSFSGLMHASDPALLKRVSDLILRHRKNEWIDVHQLRAWRSGDHLYIDFHLILPGNLTLEAAHREATELEKRLVSCFGGKASILIHMDPCIEPDFAVCGKDFPELRMHSQIEAESASGFRGCDGCD